MISTSGILSTGGEEVQADEVARRSLACARPLIGTLEVLRANTASFADDGFAFFVTSADRRPRTRPR